MNRRAFIALLLLLALAGAAAGAAASPTKAPGQTIERNLGYLRVHSLPDDLPPTAGAAGTLVLDLRFVSSTAENTAAFGTWLQGRARLQSPVLVLVNRETSAGLLALLAPAKVPAGVVSIGLASPEFSPDISLTVEAAADRTAYEALDHGLSLDDLINPRIDKVRHDEAAMARERAAANAGELDEEPPLPAVDEKSKAAAPVPPVDRVLQRAVQLYHALLALKKIP
ncbi:MAG TPA: hypothetical protein VG838_07945 [Opitutaceae bacterium]|nr:hypothetical protein [Opitutaceae bacterium]